MIEIDARDAIDATNVDGPENLLLLISSRILRGYYVTTAP
jgi:hypothetical protein